MMVVVVMVVFGAVNYNLQSSCYHDHDDDLIVVVVVAVVLDGTLFRWYTP
jgi:hypothetical protein